jgi:hypothetical protein
MPPAATPPGHSARRPIRRVKGLKPSRDNG